MSHPTERVLDRLFERHEIGRQNDTYMVRWVLIGSRTPAPNTPLLLQRCVYLHRFLRSDWDEALHDHPWNFTSLILSGGYWEHTPAPTPADPMATRRRWYGPGRILKRPATWRHRIELPPGRDCWTLVYRGPKTKSWGFFCRAGFLNWREFLARIDRNGNGNGCE